MPRAGPKKVQEYSAEFKLAAVRLSRQRGVQVQAVAAALDIHPFMLSRWRKAVRDGVLRGKRVAGELPPPPPDPPPPPRPPAPSRAQEEPPPPQKKIHVLAPPKPN